MHTGMEYVYIENAIAQLVSVESVRLQSASRSFAQQRPFNKLNLPTSKRNGSSFFPHRDYYCLFSAAVSNRAKEIGRRKPGLANREISGFYAAATANGFPRFLCFDRTNPRVGHLTRRGWSG